MMKPILFKFGVIVCILMIFSCAPNTKSNVYKVGTSIANITPKPGTYIAGDAQNRQFTGVHDSLFVKAVVVSDAHNSMAILTFDCIGLLYPTLLKIREAVSQQVPISSFDPKNIVIASTHTHSGPDVVGIWGPNQMTSGVDTAYMNNLVAKAAQAVAKALSNKQAATALYAQTEHGHDWVYNISDPLSIDRSLSVLQFKDKNGKSIATLTNFACHPTIMDKATSLVSADFVYGMYAHLDEKLGGVNLFLQGAIGGWIQPEYEKKEFASAEKRGQELGRKVADILQNGQEAGSVSVTFKSRVFNLPVSNKGFKQLSGLGVINRMLTDSVSTEAAWFTIGNAQFATHPGETTPIHALETKALMVHDGPKFVIGLGMDALGYILSPNFFDPKNPLKHTDYMLSMSIDKNAGMVLMKNLDTLSKQ